MTMRSVSRRSILKGAASAAAGAVAVGSKHSSFAAPAVLKQAGPIEVLYWGAFGGALGEAETQIVQMFNESQTDVVVNYESQNNYEELAQKVTAALAGGQAPDIALFSDVWWFKFYLANALAPLNDFIAANEIDIADFQDSLIVEGFRDDTYWWMPMARSTPLLYYNKTMFDAAGISELPATWSEFAEMAPALVDGDRKAFVHPAAASYIAWLFQGVTWAFGGLYSTPEFEMTMTNEGTVAAGEFYRMSVQDGWAGTPVEPEVDFENELAASGMFSTGGLAARAANIGDKFEWRTHFLLEELQFGCSTGGAGLAILAGSPPEKQEAAFQFIDYVTSVEGTIWWSQTTGYMPVRKSAVESEEMQAFFADNPNAKVAVDQLPLTAPQDAARVFVPNGDQIIGGGLERITISNEESAAVFEDVNAELEDAAADVIQTLKDQGKL
ncbi:MAG: ABC transporter substrate-binding protein [Thermomicrobiales bacterium]